MTVGDFISIGVGIVVIAYVSYCVINQRVWIRKEFAWKPRDEYPQIFTMNIILGVLIGIWLITSSLLFQTKSSDSLGLKYELIPNVIITIAMPTP